MIHTINSYQYRNKDEITKERLDEADIAVFGCPREVFTDLEFGELKLWLNSGGRALVLLSDGGEQAGSSNINQFLTEYGMSVNSDSVMRSAYYKYLHPKEVFISEGILVPDLIRKKNSSSITGNKKLQLTKQMQPSRDKQSRDASEDKLAFVYPYGATLNVHKPARSLLSSGPISYPMNRPIAAIWESDTVAELGAKRGRLMVFGSVEIFGDDWLDKEENGKMCDTLLSWLLNDIDLDMTSDRQDADLAEYAPIPHIEALSQNIKPCLQGMDDLPKDFTKLFDTSLFSFDTSLIPQAVKLYHLMGVPHEALTLIPPQFECPLPKLSPATFPPTMREPFPPALDQFDLDEHFAKENIRLSQLTNKCSNGEEDLEYYIAESGDILGVTKDLPFGERSAKHILLHIFKQLVDFKKQDGGESLLPVQAQAFDNNDGYDRYVNAVEALPIKSLHIAHVDLAPMKEVAGRIQLQALDPKMQIGGLAIGENKDYK